MWSIGHNLLWWYVYFIRSLCGQVSASPGLHRSAILIRSGSVIGMYLRLGCRSSPRFLLRPKAQDNYSSHPVFLKALVLCIITVTHAYVHSDRKWSYQTTTESNLPRDTQGPVLSPWDCGYGIVKTLFSWVGDAEDAATLTRWNV